MQPEGRIYDFEAPGSDWNYEPPPSDLFRLSPSALYTTDADGWLTFYNDAAAELWGYRPVLGKARWCGAWRIYREDGTSLPHDECPMAIALREGRAVRGVQAVIERPDGTQVRFRPFPSPLRDTDGTLVGGANLLMEIGSTKQNALAA